MHLRVFFSLSLSLFRTLYVSCGRKSCIVSCVDIYCISTAWWFWRTNEGHITYRLILCANSGANIGTAYSNIKSTAYPGYINLGTFVSVATALGHLRHFVVSLNRAKSAGQWLWRGQLDRLYVHDFRFCVPFVTNVYKRNRLPQLDVSQGH